MLVKLPNNAGIAVEFEGELLGKVESKEGGVLARELMTGYFVDKNANSPKVSPSPCERREEQRRSGGDKPLTSLRGLGRCCCRCETA